MISVCIWEKENSKKKMIAPEMITEEDILIAIHVSLIFFADSSFYKPHRM